MGEYWPYIYELSFSDEGVNQIVGIGDNKPIGYFTIGRSSIFLVDEVGYAFYYAIFENIVIGCVEPWIPGVPEGIGNLQDACKIIMDLYPKQDWTQAVWDTAAILAEDINKGLGCVISVLQYAVELCIQYGLLPKYVTIPNFWILGCPATLDIYDHSGRHVGLNDTGGIDKGIPGSSYLSSENESIITFPGSSEGTKVVIKGTQTGKFNLSGYINISGYNETISYRNVSVSNTTIATVDINSSNVTHSPSKIKSFTGSMGFPMEVDYNGDGVIDSVIEPNYANILPKANFTVSNYEPPVNGTITVNGSDSSDIDGYIQQYRWYFGDGSNSTGEMAIHTYKSKGDYLITLKVTDNMGGQDLTFKEIHVYNSPPNTPALPSGSTSGTTGLTCGYSTSTNDTEGDQIAYTFDWGDGTSSATGLISSGTNISESHTWRKAGPFRVRVMATDSKSAASEWSSPLNVTINSQPITPLIPSGPASGYAWVTYNYSTSSINPDGGKMRFIFNWGDRTTSATGLINSGTRADLAHMWSSAGTYLIIANATNSKNATSEWSNAFAVTIAPNLPPNTPSKPSGPALGKIGKLYKYTTSATDTDKDKVEYTFDWGDGTKSITSLVNSGAKASMSHKWNNSGTYPIKAMSIDSKGATSGWSNVLSMKVT